MKSRLQPLLSLLAVMAGSAELRAATCFTELAPAFSNAKAVGDIEGKTFATVTKHYAGGNNSGDPDHVRYAFGVLTYQQLWWSNTGWTDTVYGSNIGYRQNTTTNTKMDMFAPSSLGLAFSINAYGLVTVQELLNGKPIGGVPPFVYQGVCSSGGLVTVVDGKASWTITLTTMPPQFIR